MLLKKCRWEMDKFRGKDSHDLDTELAEFRVINADELKRELSKFPDGKDVEFTLRAFSNGFYSDLWEWEFAEEKKENTPCTHEWVNVSFTSVNMACKHCDQSAPWWIQNKHDPQTR